MFVVTPELLDAHRHDLMAAATDHRRARGAVSATPRARGWFVRHHRAA